MINPEIIDDPVTVEIEKDIKVHTLAEFFLESMIVAHLLWLLYETRPP